MEKQRHIILSFFLMKELLDPNVGEQFLVCFIWMLDAR